MQVTGCGRNELHRQCGANNQNSESSAKPDSVELNSRSGHKCSILPDRFPTSENWWSNRRATYDEQGLQGALGSANLCQHHQEADRKQEVGRQETGGGPTGNRRWADRKQEVG